MTRAKQLWSSCCIAFAGVLAAAVWINARTTSVYAGAALQQAHGIRDGEALFRAYEHEMTTVRSTLSDTAVCASIIVILLFLTIALIWIRGTTAPENAHPSPERDVRTAP